MSAIRHYRRERTHEDINVLPFAVIVSSASEDLFDGDFDGYLGHSAFVHGRPCKNVSIVSDGHVSKGLAEWALWSKGGKRTERYINTARTMMPSPGPTTRKERASAPSSEERRPRPKN